MIKPEYDSTYMDDFQGTNSSPKINRDAFKSILGAPTERKINRDAFKSIVGGQGGSAGRSWDWSKPTYGTGKTYDRSSVTFKDGKFYSGTNELTGQDQISWDAGPGGDQSPDFQSRPLWTFGTVADVLGTQKQTSQSDGEGLIYSDNPSYSTYSATANPLKGDATSNWMASKHKDVLYGVKDARYKKTAFDPTKWDGQDAHADKFRNQWGAANSTIVKEALRQLFPTKTEKEIDAAALKAFQSDRQVEQIWYGKYRQQTRKAGTSYDVQDNPISIVKNIAQQLGGLNAQQDAALAKYGQEKLLPYMKKMEKGVDGFDDSQRGITGFLNDIGPAKYLALLVPGGAFALALAEAGAGLERGDMRSAIANGIGAYLSYGAPAPTGTTTFSGALKAGAQSAATNVALQGIATGDVDLKRAAVAGVAGAAGSAAVGAGVDPNVVRFGTAVGTHYANQALKDQPKLQTKPNTSGVKRINRDAFKTLLKGG